MNPIYNEIASDVQAILKEFGVLLQFSKTGTSGTTMYSAYLVIAERVDSVLAGSNLIIGDYKSIASPGTNYAVGDRVNLPGLGRHVIADFEPISPGGIEVAKWVWLRLG